MKFVLGVFLLLVSMNFCRAHKPCSKITEEERKCMQAAVKKNGADIAAHCKGVDFDAYSKGDVSSEMQGAEGLSNS